jgi:Nucleotidyltransferase domain
MKQGSPDIDFLANVVKAATDWATIQTTIRGLALVGSHARGAAGAYSDIDFMILALDCDMFRTNAAWMKSIGWAGLGMHLTKWQDAAYDAAWSRRVWLHPNCEIEFTFAPTSWAALTPIDPGTRGVILGAAVSSMTPTEH